MVCTQFVGYSCSFDLTLVFKGLHTVIDIRNCTNLQKVHFCDIIRNPEILISPTLFAVQMLSQIVCHNVQELIFEFRKPDGIIFDWTFLANPLADPKFDCLRVIHLQADVYGTDKDTMLSERDAWQATERSIRQGALSVFDRRGLLHFTLFKYNKGSRYIIILNYYRPILMPGQPIECRSLR